jgi:hypothetical protein
MTTRDHAELENVEAYLLGALSDREMAQMAVHVRECLICRSEIRSYDRTMDMLPLSAPLRQAPETLGRKVMRRARRPGFPWKPVAGTIAAAAVVAGVAFGVNAYTWSQDLEQEVDALKQENDALNAQVAEIYPQAEQVQSLRERANEADTRAFQLETALERQQDLFLLVSKPDVKIFHASGTSRAPLATGTIMWDERQQTLHVIIKNLPRLENSAYQLWLSDGVAGHLSPMRTFNSDENGFVEVQEKIDGGIDNYYTLAVTIEPLGEEDGTPGTWVLISNVSRTSLEAQDLSIPSSPN